MAIQNFFTSRDNNLDGNTYVGSLGRLWYNPDTNSVYASDGVTVGGIPVDLATNANIIANNITVSTVTSTSGNITVTGNLVISGDISPATETKIGGIKAGPGANVSNDGTLTIDTAGLPLSFGDFTANVNILTLVNVDQNMVLATQGNAEVQLVGNIGFYKTNGFPPNVANRYFSATDDGQIRMLVPTDDPIAGAVEIVGSSSGQAASVVNPGVMLHITGQNSVASRFYNDGIGGFAAFVGRRLNGNVTAPTAVQAGDEIIRISSTGYNGTEIPGGGSARIVFQAMETYTPTAVGSNLSFWTTAIGSNVLTKIATVDSANGVNATMFTTSGTVSATGNVTGGNINTAALVSARNYNGQARNAGTLGAAGTLTIDFATDNMVLVNLTTTATIAFANITAGKSVALLVKNTTGQNRAVTLGVAAENTSGGNPAPNVNDGRTGVFVYRTFGTATGNVFCEVN